MYLEAVGGVDTECMKGSTFLITCPFDGPFLCIGRYADNLCGDCLDQLRKLPDDCVDLIYIDPPFNANRNYEVFWGETKEKRSFEDRHASTHAYIEFMRPRCVEMARVLIE
jgi:hypothetical protein